MKLRIKETGEIVELIGYFKRKSGKPDFTIGSYETLDELCKAVEDYKEPKETALEEMIRKLESDFEKYPEGWNNLEEAEKAVEKLKALNKLREKGFKFDNWTWKVSSIVGMEIIKIEANIKNLQDNFKDNKADLDLLFEDEDAADLDPLFGGEDA